jgi:hypothetical protein
VDRGDGNTARGDSGHSRRADRPHPCIRPSCASRTLGRRALRRSTCTSCRSDLCVLGRSRAGNDGRMTSTCIAGVHLSPVVTRAFPDSSGRYRRGQLGRGPRHGSSGKAARTCRARGVSRSSHGVTAGDCESLLSFGGMMKAEGLQTVLVSAELTTTALIRKHLSFEHCALVARRPICPARVTPRPRVALAAVVLVDPTTRRAGAAVACPCPCSGGTLSHCANIDNTPDDSRARGDHIVLNACRG